MLNNKILKTFEYGVDLAQTCSGLINIFWSKGFNIDIQLVLAYLADSIVHGYENARNSVTYSSKTS